MKMKKRFIVILVIVAMCLGMMSISAFAAETTKENETVVLFENRDDTDIMPYSNDYDSVWVPAGTTKGVFSIKKTFKGVGHITFKARSDNSSGSVNMCLSPYSSIDMGDTMGITTYVKVPTNDTEVKPEETVETEKTWYVHYEFKDGNPKGTFLMCWIYG